MDEKFVGFDEGCILKAISVSTTYSRIIEILSISMTGVGLEDNSNSSLKYCTDNDSGYMSQNVESNSLSSTDEISTVIVHKKSITDVYVDEDALLEKPELVNIADSKQDEEFEEYGHLYYMKPVQSLDSCIDSSIISQKSTFSGFDSNESCVSKVVHIATPLVLYSSNSIAGDLQNDSYSDITKDSNVIKPIDNICETNYENLSNLQTSSVDENSLSFTSALCNMFDNGLNNAEVLKEALESMSPTSPYCIKSYTELTTKTANTTNCTTSTPSKPTPTNLELSPELFSDDEHPLFDPNFNPSNIQLSKSSEKTNINKNDRSLITRLQESLCGVLPPPSVTIIQMSTDAMLQKIKENQHLLLNDLEYVKRDCSSENHNKSLLVNCKKEDFEDAKWPNWMKYRYHGLHYNRSKVNEDLEYMCLRYAERYVGAETQSSCTVFGMGADNSSPTKKKFKYKRVGKSPGKRLSHLARRRITFSKDSLVQAGISSGNNSFIGSRTRQIMIDARKSELLGRRTSPFKKRSPSKIPGKSPRRKIKTPSSSAKKRSGRRSRILDGDDSFDSISSVGSAVSRASSTKRTLFPSSPDKGHSTSGLLRLLGADPSENISSKRRTPRRALFPSPLKSSPSGSFLKRRLTPKRCLFSPDKSSSSSDTFDLKRKRTDSEGEPHSKFQKTFTSTSGEASIARKRTSSSGSGSISIQNIVAHRKKKLMWAVYEALRHHNIDMAHPQFKTYASILAQITRHFLPKLFVNGPPPEGSTSASMLKVARQHAFAVTRGKTIEEILKEARNAQLKPNKPSGYVGLNKVLTESADARNKDNIVHDHSSDFDNSYAKNKKKENVERIRKVIDFDEVSSSSSSSTNR